ncbi:MAG: ABC transporter permease [candidate division Zixibacteria bacterium]|nr:ABC transporter permease [candidate division Zixibacteria bacterium]
MKYQDVIDISLGNLWRMKLRTLLTLLGVIIAIGAFVSMLSLGAGMQEQVSQQFEKLGLFFNIQVYPARDSDEDVSDDKTKPPLNDSALTKLSQLPGVKLAYPFDEYQVTKPAPLLVGGG